MSEYNRKVKFDNGYEASVADHGRSYGGEDGLFEVAVLFDGQIVYDTPVTSDVIGWLDFHEVADILDQIKALPKREVRDE